MVRVPVDCAVRAEDSELPEVVTKNNEDTHRRDGECVDSNCGCHGDRAFKYRAHLDFAVVDTPIYAEFQPAILYVRC